MANVMQRRLDRRGFLKLVTSTAVTLVVAKTLPQEAMTSSISAVTPVSTVPLVLFSYIYGRKGNIFIDGRQLIDVHYYTLKYHQDVYEKTMWGDKWRSYAASSLPEITLDVICSIDNWSYLQTHIRDTSQVIVSLGNDHGYAATVYAIQMDLDDYELHITYNLMQPVLSISIDPVHGLTWGYAYSYKES